jgi:hypothetical protein
MKKLFSIGLLISISMTYNMHAMFSPKEKLIKGAALIGCKDIDLRHGSNPVFTKLYVETVSQDDCKVSEEQIEKFLTEKIKDLGQLDSTGMILSRSCRCKSSGDSEKLACKLTRKLNENLKNRPVFIRLQDGKYYAFNIILASYLNDKIGYIKSIIIDVLREANKKVRAEEIESKFNPMSSATYEKEYEEERADSMEIMQKLNSLESTRFKKMSDNASYSFDSPPSSYRYNGVAFGHRTLDY